MQRVAEREPHLTAEQVRDEVAAGRMVIPANIDPPRLQARSDGASAGPRKTKINANMGASPVSSSTDEEVEKLDWAEKWAPTPSWTSRPAATSTTRRDAIIRNSTVPIGTVPIYSMIIGRKIEDLDSRRSILDAARAPGRAGRRLLHDPRRRRCANTSRTSRTASSASSARGGRCLAKWMIVHGEQNPMYTQLGQICDVMRRVRRHVLDRRRSASRRPRRRHRPRPSSRSSSTLGELTERAWQKGVQVMIEGPGHVPFDQIEYNMKLQRTLCHGGSVLRPRPARHRHLPRLRPHHELHRRDRGGVPRGAAMLCYVTPKEHLGLPKKDDVKQGCVAYKIAAHAADVALGIPGTRDRDDELTKAPRRPQLGEALRARASTPTPPARTTTKTSTSTPTSARCAATTGAASASQGDRRVRRRARPRATQWEKPKVGGRAHGEQQEILEQRGRLEPDEIHRLATKTERRWGPTRARPPCHSDYVDDETAQQAAGKEQGAGRAGNAVLLKIATGFRPATSLADRMTGWKPVLRKTRLTQSPPGY